MKYYPIQKIILGFFVVILSAETYGDDFNCPYDYPMTVEPLGIVTKNVALNKGQNFVEVSFSANFKDRELYDVSIVEGEWKYNDSGVLISSPNLTASLKVEGEKKPRIRFLRSDSTKIIKLVIIYGGDCGYRMEVAL